MTHGQLLNLGFGVAAIRWRVECGRLHPVMLGVYAVGRPALDRYGRWMAAVLSCGLGAVLSHLSAAALYGIATELGPEVEISIPASSDRRRPGVRVHRRPSLEPRELTVSYGIPVTGAVRTLLDLATRLDSLALERAVNAADRVGLIGHEALAPPSGATPAARASRRCAEPSTGAPSA